MDSSLSTKIEIFISGRKLKDLDAFSKSDPYCKVEMNSGTAWVPVGKTETKMN